MLFVRYIGKKDTPAFDRSKKYAVLSKEKGRYRIITELGEDYISPSNDFEIVKIVPEKFLCLFKEYGDIDAPSMKEFFEPEPYQNMEKIAQYLENGEPTFARTNIPYDFFTGERLPQSRHGWSYGMTDGEYSWMNTLPYYVRKYNLRLPLEFEKKVLTGS